jgi:imidazolonepropionase-like amidohydrolase
MVNRIWPLYSDEVRDVLVEESEQRDLPLLAHAISPQEVALALDMGVAAFVHPPQALPKKLLVQLQAAQTPVVSTLSVFDSLLIAPEPERLDDPTVRLLVPEIEREAAADPDILDRYARAVADSVLPRMPGFVKRFAAGMFQKAGPLAARRDKVAEVVRTLDASGVTVVMGSDSGNWPVFPFEFHGFTSVREVELLGEAGIPPARVLEIATLNGARLLGREKEIGTIEAGKRADLILLDGDPLEDLSVLRTPRMVFRAGEGRTPQAWMGP